MKTSLLALPVALILAVAPSAFALDCEVSSKTISQIEYATTSELPYESVIRGHVMPALATDACIQSTLRNGDYEVMAEQIFVDVFKHGSTVRDSINNYLAF